MRNSSELDHLLADLKKHIGRLREEEKELEKTLADLKQIDQLGHVDTHMNEMLRRNVEKFEQERRNCEEDNANAIAE